MMIRVRSLDSGYNGRRVIKSLSMHVNSGEIVAIIGANGAGKTTLLNTLAGLIRAQSGQIEICGEDSRRKRAEQIVSSGCALVPEGRELFPFLSVKENLVLGAYSRIKAGEKSLTKDRLDSVFGLFPRLSERKAQYAGSLSGGEQQMLAIGRALMSDPRLIMLDEPSMGLAPLVVKDILATIGRLRGQGKTILVVEQNARAILKLADRGYVMESGSLIIEGASGELLKNRDVQRAYLGKEYSSIAE
jgi:branched-chain amino acid transport system ATP-binding protein